MRKSESAPAAAPSIQQVRAAAKTWDLYATVKESREQNTRCAEKDSQKNSQKEARR